MIITTKRLDWCRNLKPSALSLRFYFYINSRSITSSSHKVFQKNQLPLAFFHFFSCIFLYFPVCLRLSTAWLARFIDFSTLAVRRLHSLLLLLYTLSFLTFFFPNFLFLFLWLSVIIIFHPVHSHLSSLCKGTSRARSAHSDWNRSPLASIVFRPHHHYHNARSTQFSQSSSI